MTLPQVLMPSDAQPIGSWRPHRHEPLEQGRDVFQVLVDESDTTFRAPEDWRKSWLDFDILLSPLAIRALDFLSEVPVLPFEWKEAANEVVPGIRQIPLESPTLPPAAHTNAYLVGDEQLVLIDPATHEPSERDKLESIIRGLISNGSVLKAVILTHHHFDHFGAAEWAANTFSVPIWAHPLTQDLLDDQLEFSRKLDEDDQVDLGRDRQGRMFKLRVRFTPGHAPGHIVLCDERPGSDAMIVGDMVAAVGTIIIDPDEGDMNRYIKELRRLLELKPGCLFPAHGPPIPNGPDKLTTYINHRLMRESMVFAAVSDLGPASPTELLEQAYADTPRQLYPLAERACIAHLIKLVQEGRVSEIDGKYGLVKSL